VTELMNSGEGSPAAALEREALHLAHLRAARVPARVADTMLVCTQSSHGGVGQAQAGRPKLVCGARRGTLCFDRWVLAGRSVLKNSIASVTLSASAVSLIYLYIPAFAARSCRLIHHSRRTGSHWAASFFASALSLQGTARWTRISLARRDRCSLQTVMPGAAADASRSASGSAAAPQA
jgi:hypothetical protein